MRWPRCFLAGWMAAAFFASPAWATAPMFSPLPLEQARAQALEEKKLLLIDFTAEWCAPCQVMDESTWVDPAVVQWLGAHAVAVQVDVDAQEEIARSFQIEAMPTLVILREGKEFARVDGYQEPGELLEWLEGVRQGKTKVDQLKANGDSRVGTAGPADIETRYALAKQLALTGR